MAAQGHHGQLGRAAGPGRRLLEDEGGPPAGQHRGARPPADRGQGQHLVELVARQVVDVEEVPGHGMPPPGPRPAAIGADLERLVDLLVGHQQRGGQPDRVGPGAFTTSPRPAPRPPRPRPARRRAPTPSRSPSPRTPRHPVERLQPAASRAPARAGPGGDVLGLHDRQGGRGRGSRQWLAPEGGAVVPGPKAAATSARAQQAPMGTPLPRALAMVTTSGSSPVCWKPNHRPVRPRPVWTSSTMRRIPRSCTARARRSGSPRTARSPRPRPGSARAGRRPPAPGHTRRRGRRGRRRGRVRTPRATARTGRASRPGPVACRVASVRPWKEPHALTTTWRPGPAHFRASLSAHSLASAPELVKKTCPPARLPPPPMRRSRVAATSGADDVAEEVRDVEERARLLGQRLGHDRVGVPERGHRQAAEEVEVTPALVSQSSDPSPRTKVTGGSA